MLVLGVESSCDESALALVNEEGILASVMATQIDIHALFGGVVPELASREHARLMPLLFDELWRRAGWEDDPEAGWAGVDRIAVTRGPGLLGSLLVGVAFAKALAFARGIPLIGVNHLNAHLLVAGLEKKLEFPALGVLVSGGHTHLYRMDGPAEMDVLGGHWTTPQGRPATSLPKWQGCPIPAGRCWMLWAGAERLMRIFFRDLTRIMTILISVSVV